MATEVQQQVRKIEDKISEMYSMLSSLEYEIGELNIPDIEDNPADHVTLTCEAPGLEWSFTKIEAAQAFDLLDQIGLNAQGKYSLVTIEQIRLAVERILR